MIEQIEIRRLRLPLTKPYRLSFGVQHAFDTLLVTIACGGRSGFGEATLLPGYTDESIDQSWETALAVAPRLAGQQMTAARGILSDLLPVAAFTATAFLTALDMIGDHPAFRARDHVELLAILSSDGGDLGKARDEVDRLVEAGYRTLKFKVGFGVEQDVPALAVMQRAVDGRARLRVDANQGFTPQEAITFLDRIDPEGIELLEQPCDKADWAAAEIVRPHARVPIMLDESIFGTADIDRAADGGLADLIKLKLMKLGDISSLQAALDRIRLRGMEPVLGNGVATDIGCWMECAAAPGHVTLAGEMNGFLKTPVQLLDPPLSMVGAHVLLPGELPRLNTEAVARVSDASRNFS
ncbi:MAG: enolase C-terminal domain-like protein [Pseudomonadota bacterium]|nr:enolase C-terminal domain-like protein [Pseudomonadota bacterium]